jgi:hypothetical protein
MHSLLRWTPGIQGDHDEVWVMESRANANAKKKRSTKRSLTRSFVVTVAVGIPSALLANAGCSSSNNPDNATGGGPQTPAPGATSDRCTTEGAQQPCHVNLGMTGGGQFQSCFAGTQTCTGGHWSACGGDGTVTNTLAAPGLNLAPASAGVSTGGVHTLAVTLCGNGICDGVQVCSGGPSDGNICLTAATCGGAPCVVQKTCVAGSNTGDTCSRDSDCGGGGAGSCNGIIESCSSCPQDCGTCPVGPPDASAPICASDPCNPGCLGFSQGTAVTSAGGTSGATIIGVTGFGQINNGQISKLLLDNLNTGKKCDDYVTPGLPSSYYNCQIDTYCSMVQLGGDGNCHQFKAGGTQGSDLRSMGPNTGTDVTIGPGCSDRESDKYRYFPICNRGAVSIPVGTIIRVKYANPNTPFDPCPNNTCTTTTGYDCSMKVGDAVSKNGSTATAGKALLPGECQLLDTQEVGMAPGGAACSQPNGDKWIFANCDGATTGVAEGTMTMKPGAGPVGVTGAPDNQPTTAPGILGCANNWTDHSSNNNPPSCGVAGQNVVSLLSSYHATCPTGFGPVWSKLIYDTTCPKNASGTSEVFFEAATAPDVAGAPGVLSPYYEIGEAQANNGGTPYVIGSATLGSDPEQCSFTLPFAQSPGYSWGTCTNTGPGPSPNCCPKDFSAQFTRGVTQTPFPGAGPVTGKTIAQGEWLSLHVVIKATPDNKKDAVLNSYSLSYQCVARE